MLQYHFNWTELSVIAGITFRRFYFRLFPGAIKGPQIIEFLHALGQQLRTPLLVIWDGLAAHRSALVREYIEERSTVRSRSNSCPPMRPNSTPPNTSGAISSTMSSPIAVRRTSSI